MKKLVIYALLAIIAISGGIGAGVIWEKLNGPVARHQEALKAEPVKFDDPAVAVCEFYHRKVTGNYPDTGVRTLETFTGSTLRLEYSVSVLNTAPQKRTILCQFQVLDGAFTMILPDRQAAKTCLENNQAAINARDERIKQKPNERLAAYQEAWKQLHDCVVVQENEDRRVAEISRVFTVPLTLSGIYPILPQTTALKPAG